MGKETEKLKITEYNQGVLSSMDILVPKEKPVTIILNDEELVRIMITPDKIREFTLGFLYGQGIIKSLDDIKTELIGEKKGILYIETKKQIDAKKLLSKSYLTTGCGGGVSFSQFNNIKPLEVKTNNFALENILLLAKDFSQKGELYRSSGGFHAGGLADKNGFLYYAEDVGRHNAVDKVIGYCLIDDIKTNDKMLFTTGRIASEMIPKVARAKIPLIISRSTPTDLAVLLAQKLGLTVIGYARGQKANVYTSFC
ncbi:MAG: formate dehydrogenase accessory sulfurtransferase FdhD [Actinobacteria bacterium]|nr:MAG: formate dehydrogenase accessory sulfurtransferase FdhD [Actinomycetota bacterium]